VTHDHVVDLVGGDAGPLQGGGDGVTAQLHGGEGGEGAAEAADRGAGAGDDDGLWQGHL
jgi:hypothetical protein